METRRVLISDKRIHRHGRISAKQSFAQNSGHPRLFLFAATTPLSSLPDHVSGLSARPGNPSLRRKMDARVKPGHDNPRGGPDAD